MAHVLYILIRDDLTVAQQGVQAGHAVAEWCKLNHTHDWDNDILIYVTCNHIDFWRTKLQTYGESISIFREPDLGNIITAIACVPTRQNIFDKLPLWNPEASH